MTSEIKSFDRTTVRMIDNEMETALQTIAQKYGITIQRASSRYASDHFTTKFEVRVKQVDANGDVVNPRLAAQAAEFTNYHMLFQMQKDDLGKSVVINGETVKIIGLAPRSHRFPILCEKKSGKVFKYTRDSVILALGRQPRKPLGLASDVADMINDQMGR